MRKLFTLLFVALVSFGMFSNAYATTCAGAVAIPGTPAFPWVSSLTCGATNDITSANATVCGNGSYRGGLEAVYSWTPTGSYTNVTFAYSGQTWSGLFLYQGCPTSGGTCIANFTGSGAAKTLAYVGTNLTTGTPITLTSGVTYYLVIDTWPTPNSPCPGTLTINGTLLAPCVSPAAQPTALNLVPTISSVGGTFTASATADSYLVVRSTNSSLSATPVTGTVYAAGAPLGGGTVVYFGSTASFNATGLNPATLYYFFVFGANNVCSGGPVYRTASPLTGSTTTLTPPTFCGTKTIGASGADYTTLTTAMTALAGGMLTCPVTLLLNANYNSASETYPIVVPSILGSSAANTLTIKPAPGVTASISGARASGALVVVKNNYTIIDGSNAAGGTSRNLSITNTSATSPTVVLFGSTGTTSLIGCTLKNSIITNGVNTSTPVVISDGTTLGAQGYFNYITIQNNLIQKAYIGIYATGGTVPQTGQNLSILQNTLESTGANAIAYVGIYMQGVTGAYVGMNSIGNFDPIGAQDDRGVWLATGTINAIVERNFIHDLTYTGTGGYGAYGVAVSTGQSAANITVASNAIYNIWGDGWDYTTVIGDNPLGIYAFTTQTGINIYFNSINMYGNHLNQTNALAAGIVLGTGTTARVMNNMIVNNMGLSAGLGYGATGIFAQTANTQFEAGGINYNNYYINPSSGAMNIGMIAAAGSATLAAWQIASGQEGNSLNGDPLYTSASNLLPTNNALINKGYSIPTVTSDILGVGRTNPPDIGAYQFSPLHLVNTTAANAISLTGATLNGNITASNLTVASGFDYGLTSSYSNSVSGVPLSVTGNTQTNISAVIGGLTMNTLYHYRAKGTSGSNTVYGADMTFTTAGPPIVTTQPATIVGATFATLNGTVNPNNDNTTVSFEYGLTVAYGTPVPVTGTYSGNTVQAFSKNISGLTINTWYHYRAKAVNGAGTTYGADQMFFTTCVVPPAPGTITGPATVCKGVTTNTYSVAQVPYGFYYNWTFPTGFVITTYEHSNVVTVTVLNTAVSGTISVIAVSDCGAPSIPSTKAVVVNDVPVPTVAGNASVCQYVNNTYTTQAGNSAYVWSVSPDGTITPTSNPDIVTINWAASGAKTVGVVYTNPTTGCTAPTPGTKPVTVNAAPVPVIAGPTNMCVNSGYFNYTTETGKSNYTWTVSSGGTITGGQGTANLEVFWNTPGAQVVTVNYSDGSGCYANTPSSYNVTVDGLPGVSGSISGSADVCYNSSGVSYSVAPISNAAYYVWSLPAGATIVTGEGTSNIVVNFDATAVSGNITVYGNSLCGNGTLSPAFPVTVHQIPGAAGTITGPAAVCEGSTGIEFSVPPVTEASGYHWNVPVGATIVFGDNTPTILVDFAVGAVSGVVNVYGTNLCGNGVVSADLPVTVFPIPETPVITLNGDILSSSIAEGNQWYYNGALIYGATGQTQLAQYSGWYWDVITKNGCSSDTSNNIYVTITGIEDPQASNFVISPVPNNGSFQATINSPVEQNFNIMVYNQLGEMIYESKDNKVKGVFEKNIDLRPVPSGIYSVIFQSADKRVTKKIIINK